MPDFSRAYTRSKKKNRVDEPEGDPAPIESSGASSGPILRPRMSRASQSNVVDVVVVVVEWKEELRRRRRRRRRKKKKKKKKKKKGKKKKGKKKGKMMKKRRRLCLRLGGKSIPALIA
jgi:hypothetical protein